MYIIQIKMPDLIGLTTGLTLPGLLGKIKKGVRHD